MVKKIIFSFFIVSLFIAIPLAVLGVKKIDLGTGFLWFMQKVDSDLAAWKVEIPQIPTILPLESNDWYIVVLNFLIKIWQAISVVINIVIVLFNYIIQLIQFICTLIFDLGALIGYAASSGDYNYIWAW